LSFSAKSKIDFDDLAELKSDNETFKFGRTNFAFMDEHFGFRPGCFHVVHAKTSGGKTTLARCLLCNISGSTKVLWYATEESLSDWKLKFNFSRLPITRNVSFVSEDDVSHLSTDEWFLFFEMQIKDLGEGVVIFDNITTSRFYNDKQYGEQSAFVVRLKALLKKYPVSILIIAHFNGDAKLPMFSSKDVRGSKTLPNIAEYWYNLHRLRIDNSESTIEVSLLHVEKARSHSTSDKCYQLDFDKKLGNYLQDRAISWGVAKEFIEKQVKIGKR
jgi:KaiC/GvpD/RAD55 family RecA-like ATPase